jgi:hypothetical protein
MGEVEEHRQDHVPACSKVLSQSLIFVRYRALLMVGTATPAGHFPPEEHVTVALHMRSEVETGGLASVC